MRVGEAKTPEGLRIYAIGDVHGCDDLLAAVHERIDVDLAARPTAGHRIVHLGDLIDRGPNTAAVIERVSRLATEDDRVLCLRGNHEEMLLDFLADPIGGGPTFFANGGEATLASYGISMEGVSSPRDLIFLTHEIAMQLPAAHRKFISRLPYSLQFGDYFFCHAGVKPGTPLDRQNERDLVWIREGFLDSDADFGAVVIHGHTPASEPEVKSNRINVDTGAVMGGPLSCLVLERDEYRFL